MTTKPETITIAGVELQLEPDGYYRGEALADGSYPCAWLYDREGDDDSVRWKWGCSLHFGPASVGGVAATLEELDALVRARIDVARRRGLWYHVGRVNSAKRIRAAAESGATSFDGTSVTMYAETLPLLDDARREGTLEHGPASIPTQRDVVADAQLVERELASYRDDEDVTLSAAALRVLLDRARGHVERGAP
jgi:hypothetical protein